MMKNSDQQMAHLEISFDIIDVGRFLEFPLTDIHVEFPEKIDDFQSYDRIMFSAMNGEKRTGGSIRFYENHPQEWETYRAKIKRTFTWSLLLQERKTKGYIQLAENVYNPAYPDRSLLKALLVYYWKTFIYRFKNRRARC
jgi:hypothetical protein